MRVTKFSIVRSRATMVVAMLLILALPAVAVAGLLGGLLGVVGSVVGGVVGVLAPPVSGPGPFVLRFEPTKLPEHVHLESADATFLAN